MSRIIDNVVAYRIVKMLVQPFKDTAAYHLGIVDANGNVIRKSKDLHTVAEKDAYNYLTRLVFGLKKLINHFGGESKLKSLVAALWLVKEQYKNTKYSKQELQEKFDELIKLMDNKVCLAEEELIVSKVLSEDGAGAGAGGVGAAAISGGSPANHTGSAVSTDSPKIYKKDIKKYHNSQPGVISGLARRKQPIK